jgi:hypothetical protein
MNRDKKKKDKNKREQGEYKEKSCTKRKKKEYKEEGKYIFIDFSYRKYNKYNSNSK